MPVPPPIDEPLMASRRLWLPRPLYSLVPYVYAATGVAALLSAIYIPHWYWGAPLLLLVALLALHATARIVAQRHRRHPAARPADGSACEPRRSGMEPASHTEAESACVATDLDQP